MANNQIQIIITAKDEASKVLGALGGNVDRLSRATERNTPLSAKLSENWTALAGVTASAGIGLHSLTGEVNTSIGAASRLQAALTGLNTVARAFNQDAKRAEDAAKSLASDGLMTVAESATALKNLLASGFSLDQSITLISRFKDTAAFGRQSALGFGQAVASATEGIKNGNSILVDNAGVTKNLSVILEEAGFSAQDLMKATTDASVRQALFNGLLKETAPQLGDAKKLAEQYAGSQARLSASTETLRQRLGTVFQTALLPIITAVTPLVTKLADWVSKHQKLTAAIVAGGAAFLGLVTVLGLIGGAIALLAPLVAAFGAAVVAAVPLIGALLVGLAVAIIANWQAVRDFFLVTIPAALGTAFDWIKARVEDFRANFFSNVGQAIGFFATLPIRLPLLMAQAIAGVIQAARNVDWGAVAGWFGDAWRRQIDMVRQGISNLFNWVKGIDWGGVAKYVITTNVNAIMGLIEGAVRGAFKGLPGGVENKFRLPRFEKGVRNFEGGMAIVGERGPELVSLPRGSNVYSNRESRQMVQGAGRGGGVTINQTNNIFNQVDLDLAVERLGWELAI